MSEHEIEEKNGTDDEVPSVDEIKRLVAIVEVCAVHAERSFLESQASKRASVASLQSVERIEKVLKNVLRAIKRLADDQLELRSGVPANWRDRILLVVFTSVLSAGIAAIVVGLAAHR